VEHTDFSRFEDWGAGGEILGGAINLARHHGLAHGEAFRDWFAEQTQEMTFGDIKRAGRTLKLIATDITRHEMLVLPDALPAYRTSEHGETIEIDRFRVADAVRMSMSIPYFFQPVELWHESGAVSTIVDGGVLSNFPVWIFDVADRDPVRPTFGFKLTGGRAVGSGLQKVMRAFGWPLAMGVDIFHTTTEAWDSYWVTHATRVRTCPISAGDIGTTDFNLSGAQKQWLLESGAQGARAFLGQWDPAQYVNSNGRRLAGAGQSAAA
jgi:NTE family protein